MSEIEEQQAEEREALQSIYEGDENYKQIDEKTFQYKYGVDNNNKSFLVEVKWTANYPNEPPIINMDTFYNGHVVPAVKDKIRSKLQEEAQNWLGMCMTYTLFEFLKDIFEEITAEQPEHAVTNSLETSISAIKISDNSVVDANKKKEPKKEQLTKAQKRRQWERTDHKGERPRGWDWVDIVKHLSQTGGSGHKDTEELTPNSAMSVS